MDYGFFYGYGLFETMRAYGGTVFRLDEHLARLAGSAKRLGIEIDITVLTKAVVDTLEANSLADARIRLAVSPGEGNIVPDLRTCVTPSILVAATEYTPYDKNRYEKGYNVTVTSIRRNSQSPILSMKTANYMENLLARQEAKTAGFDDALFLNEKGQVTEASTSNVFMVSKNILTTSTPESGILPGITRDVILELVPDLGIDTREEDIRLEEFEKADEAFLTNSILEIMPITNLNGKTIGNGIPGVITQRLMTAYKNLVYKETHPLS
jgi:branched-chain amino acid aminotransferase group I